MLRRNNRVNLPPQQLKKTGHIKLMSRRFIRSEIFFREPKEPHRRVHPPPVLWMGRACVLLLQVHKAAGRLNQSLEIIRVLGFRP